uniref:Uncharacterized protein n=1 Tax=Anguilla anguilla TaxID=7936 RepID=A0A0E9V8R5_ANGAN
MRVRECRCRMSFAPRCLQTILKHLSV